MPSISNCFDGFWVFAIGSHVASVAVLLDWTGRLALVGIGGKAIPSGRHVFLTVVPGLNMTFPSIPSDPPPIIFFREQRLTHSSAAALWVNLRPISPS